MRPALLLALLAVLFANNALAWPPGANTPFGPKVNTYTGIGDVTSFTFWCGFRAFTAATAGTKAVQIKRASDSTTTDINTLASGDFDTASANTFCTSTTCTVPKCYDKAGSGTDLTSSSSPNLIFSCKGSSPCMQMVNNTPTMAGPSSSLTLGVASFYVVFSRYTGTSGNIYPMAVLGAGAGAGFRSIASANTLSLTGTAGTSFNFTSSDATWHAIQGVVNGVSSVATVDSTDTTGTVTSALSSGNMQVTGGGGEWLELGMLKNSAWSSGTRSSIHTNVSAYWGTP